MTNAGMGGSIAEGIQKERVMGRPLRITYPGAHYHITARGNEQKDIFKSRRDREQFLSYLESSAIRYGAVNTPGSAGVFIAVRRGEELIRKDSSILEKVGAGK